MTSEEIYKVFFDAQEEVFPLTASYIKWLEKRYSEMLEALIDDATTYDVLKEIFENENPGIWGYIKRAFLNGRKKHLAAIEKATGKTWEDIKDES
jgi:hypothetical protein